MAPSKLKRINTGVPQSGVLSPTLFNIHTSDIPLPPKDVQITTYADDITITASHTKHRKAQQLILILPYLHQIDEKAITNYQSINQSINISRFYFFVCYTADNHIKMHTCGRKKKDQRQNYIR